MSANYRQFTIPMLIPFFSSNSFGMQPYPHQGGSRRLKIRNIFFLIRECKNHSNFQSQSLEFSNFNGILMTNHFQLFLNLFIFFLTEIFFFSGDHFVLFHLAFTFEIKPLSINHLGGQKRKMAYPRQKAPCSSYLNIHGPSDTPHREVAQYT